MKKRRGPSPKIEDVMRLFPRTAINSIEERRLRDRTLPAKLNQIETWCKDVRDFIADDKAGVLTED